MISDIDKSISFQNSRNVAAELLKTLKRDVPFETEADILAAHDRLTNALYDQYLRFRGEGVGVTDTPANTVEVPKDVPATPAVAKEEVKVEAVAPATPAKAVTTSEPAVLAMVQKAVDAVTTKDGCTELKAKILKATKISLQDQSMLLAKLDAKIGAM